MVLISVMKIWCTADVCCFDSGVKECHVGNIMLCVLALWDCTAVDNTYTCWCYAVQCRYTVMRWFCRLCVWKSRQNQLLSADRRLSLLLFSHSFLLHHRMTRTQTCKWTMAQKTGILLCQRYTCVAASLTNFLFFTRQKLFILSILYFVCYFILFVHSAI